MTSFLAALGAGALLAIAGAPAQTLASAATAQSPDRGSRGRDAAHANVYVPPAAEQAPSAGRNYANEVSTLSNEQLAAAYGTAIPQWIPTPASTTAASDNTNRWRIAAIIAAGLIAAIALGAAAVLRPRALRTGT